MRFRPRSERRLRPEDEQSQSQRQEATQQRSFAEVFPASSGESEFPVRKLRWQPVKSHSRDSQSVPPPPPREKTAAAAANVAASAGTGDTGAGATADAGASKRVVTAANAGDRVAPKRVSLLKRKVASNSEASPTTASIPLISSITASTAIPSTLMGAQAAQAEVIDSVLAESPDTQRSLTDDTSTDLGNILDMESAARKRWEPSQEIHFLPVHPQAAASTQSDSPQASENPQQAASGPEKTHISFAELLDPPAPGTWAARDRMQFAPVHGAAAHTHEHTMTGEITVSEVAAQVGSPTDDPTVALPVLPKEALTDNPDDLPQAKIDAQASSENGKALPRHSVLSETLVVSISTLVSRILGFVRLMVAMIVLTKVVNDVFQLANTLPTQIYDLLISSAFSAVLVPAIVKSRHEKEQNRLVTALFTVGGLGMLIIAVIATVASPVIVKIMGYSLPRGWYWIAVLFSFWCMPKIFFFGLHALLGQYLNANRRFLAYAITPALNNVIQIAALFWFNSLYNKHSAAGMALLDPANWDAKAVAILVAPTTLGIAAQAIALIPAVRRAGFRMVFPIKVRGLGLGKTMREGLWATMVVGATYLRVWALTNIAVAAFAYGTKHHLQVPSVTDQFAASLFYALPFSVLILSVVNVIFPRIVTAYLDEGGEAVQRLTLNFHRYTAPLTVFCAMFLITAALPLAQILTMMSNYNADLVALALAAMSFKLVPSTTSLLNGRLLYTENKAKAVFWTNIPGSLFVVITGWIGVWLLPAMYWLPNALLMDAIGALIVSVTQHRAISPDIRVPLRQEVAYYVRPILGAIITSAVAFGGLWLVGFHSVGLWDLLARGIALFVLEVVLFGLIGVSKSQRQQIMKLLLKRRMA